MKSNCGLIRKRSPANAGCRRVELANSAYNAFVGSLESQVMTQAKRFEALEVSSGAKEIEPLPVIETAPRTLAKLVSGEATEAAE